MPDLDAIQRLITQYQALSPIQRRTYNEAQTRITFIDALFRALGWNLEDPTQVQVEHSIVSGRADYAFKLGGSIRFYVEAKRLEDDLYREGYARQAITYAYNTGVGFAVLCNFTSLVAFDTLESCNHASTHH
jgi:predicted type IV restriction endonuclease